MPKMQNLIFHDQYPVAAEELIDVHWAGGLLYKISKIEFNGENRIRVTIAHPLGSVAVHLSHEKHLTAALQKLQEQTDKLHTLKLEEVKPWDAGPSTRLAVTAPCLVTADQIPGCVWIEPRGYPTWGSDYIPSEKWIDPTRTYRTRDGRTVMCVTVELANSSGRETTYCVKASVLRPSRPGKKPAKPDYFTYTLDGKKDLDHESAEDLFEVDQGVESRQRKPSFADWFSRLQRYLKGTTNCSWSDVSGDSLEAKQYYIDGADPLDVVKRYIDKYDLVEQ